MWLIKSTFLIKPHILPTPNFQLPNTSIDDHTPSLQHLRDVSRTEGEPPRYASSEQAWSVSSRWGGLGPASHSLFWEIVQSAVQTNTSASLQFHVFLPRPSTHRQRQASRGFNTPTGCQKICGSGLGSYRMLLVNCLSQKTYYAYLGVIATKTNTLQQ